MVLLGLKLLMKMLLVQMKPQSILLTGRNFALDAAQLNDWSLRHVDYCGHFDGHLSAMNSVNHHDVAEEIHFPWTLLDGALTRNLVKKFDRQHEKKSFLKHTYIRAKLLLCFVQIAFLEKMAGYSRMAVSSTGACKRRLFPCIHLRSMSSSRVVGCLAFRVCCVPHADYLPICVVYRWYMSMTEQDILQLLFYSETSSSSSYLEQLLQFSRNRFSFCERWMSWSS